MELKIISFNIRGDDDPNGHSIAERAPRLKTFIDECDPDIMGFQEYLPKWEAYIERDYTDDFEFFVKGRGENDPEATPILWRKSRFDCIEKGYFWFSDTPDIPSGGWDKACNCLRICNWVHLKSKENGKEFLYFNTHYGFGEEFQIKSAAALNQRTKGNLPAVITGDFNLTMDSAGYGELMKYFKDVNMETAQNLHNTYHGYKGKTQQKPIDFCFVNDLAKPVSYQILNRDFDGKYASDHHGIFAVVEI